VVRTKSRESETKTDKENKFETAKMDIIIDQETNMNTIAALSTIAVSKTDNTRAAINRQVQTDIVKGTAVELQNLPAYDSFNNLPPCDPIEIYFKDLSFTVQKMFSKS
jgi:hypothetical protein